MVSVMAHPLQRYIQETPGETHTALALRADVSRMTLWRLIAGKGEFSTGVLKQVSEATGGRVSVAELAAALAETPAQGAA